MYDIKIVIKTRNVINDNKRVSVLV